MSATQHLAGENPVRSGGAASARVRVALVQRFVPHYNLVFYQKLLASSRYDWEFIYGSYPGGGESGLATDAPRILPTRPIRNVSLGSALWQRGVTGWLREQKYSAVVFELGWQIISNVALIRAAHAVGTRVIPWTKGIAESGRPRSFCRRWAERVFTRQCDALLVYGGVSAEYFKAYNYPADRIFVAQNTVDVRAIAAAAPQDRVRCQSVRTRHRLDARPVLGYLGRLVPQKRVDLIIDSFALARRGGMNAQLVIAGDGPDRVQLEQRARACGFSDDIRFCGRVPESEVGAYFQLFDVYVSAWAAGLGILEAMAHAKIPLITPEARPETEQVRDDVTGIIAKGYTVEALAEGMRRAAEKAQAGGEMGQAAQREVLAHATMEKMVEAFDSAIACALTSPLSK